MNTPVEGPGADRRGRDPVDASREVPTSFRLRDADAHLALAATMQPTPAAAYLDAVLASYERRMMLLDGAIEHNQTLAEVQEHEEERGTLEREHALISAARGAYPAPRGVRRARKLRVVVADDDDEILAVVTTALRHDGHHVAPAHDGLELLALLSAAATRDVTPPAVIVSDVRMPIFNGLDALRNARSFGLEVPFILMTAYRDPAITAFAEELGVSALLHKPFEMDLLRRRVSDAVMRAS